MQASQQRLLCAFVFCLATVACHSKPPDSDARARLATVLRDSLGEDAGANVSFRIDDDTRRESHLYLTFDTTIAPNVTDSVFERRARDIARLAVRHYQKAGELERITVATREQVQPGAWRVRHSSTFAVAALGAPVTPPLPVDTSSPQVSLTIPEACDAFATIFTASATANGMSAAEVGVPRDTAMSFGEMHPEHPEPACRVAWRDEAGHAPLGDVFARAAAAGWTERPGLLAADGPDGSILAVSRGNVACLVSGEWDGGDDSDSTYVPAPGFTISARCYVNRPDRY